MRFILKLDDRFENFRTVKIKHLKLQLANNQFLVKSLKSGRLIDMRGRFEGRGVIVRLFSFGSVNDENSEKLSKTGLAEF